MATPRTGPPAPTSDHHPMAFTRSSRLNSEKIKAMEAAGFLMAASPAELGTTLQEALKRGPPTKKS